VYKSEITSSADAADVPTSILVRGNSSRSCGYERQRVSAALRAQGGAESAFVARFSSPFRNVEAISGEG
jgi:hypothetical protein